MIRMAMMFAMTMIFSMTMRFFDGNGKEVSFTWASHCVWQRNLHSLHFRPWTSSLIKNILCFFATNSHVLSHFSLLSYLQVEVLLAEVASRGLESLGEPWIFTISLQYQVMKIIFDHSYAMSPSMSLSGWEWHLWVIMCAIGRFKEGVLVWPGVWGDLGTWS